VRNLSSTSLSEYIYVLTCCFFLYYTDVMNSQSAFLCLKHSPLWQMCNKVQVKVIRVILCVEWAIRAQWLLYVPPGLTFPNSTFCPHSVFMCFVWISEQTAIISLYSINWLVFVTETGCVYCAVRTESLYVISPVVTLSTARFNIHKFYVLLTQCVYVFCVDLRTNSDYFPTRH
jgi:hypothetical protein